MTISTGDKALYRTSKMQTLDPTLVSVPVEIVATAIIDVAPTSYPAASLTLDDFVDWAEVEEGYFFKIVNSENGEITTWGVVRQAPTDDITLLIDAKSQGDPGLAINVHQSIAVNDIVSIYRIRPIWTMLSRIANGVFFKRFNEAYDGSGSSPNPVVNIGKHQIIKVKTAGEEGVVNLDASNSFAQATKTISAYLWTLPAEATILSGTTTTVSLSISLPQGFYEVSCRITDSGSKTFTAVRAIWVVGPDNPALSDSYGIEIGSDESSLTGREMTFTISGTIGDDVLLPGSMIAFRDFPRYDNQTVAGTELIEYFCGFITDRKEVYEEGVEGTKSVTFTAKSPFNMLNLIPQVSQVINEVNSPNSWEEVSKSLGLSNVNFAIWYIIKHHTTALEMFDYYPLDEATPPRKKAWGLNGNTIAAQCEEISSAVLGNIGSVSDGSFWFMRNPNVESNTYRTALEMVHTWETSDLTASVEINRLFFNQVAYIRAYALAMQNSNNTIAVASIAPGTQQGQAIGSSQYENILMPPGSNQTEINVIAGHLYAKENNPLDNLSFSVARNYDIIEPAKMVWHTIDIPASASPTGRRLFHRILPKSVSRSWEQTDDGSWIKTISFEASAETFGQPGVKLPIKPSDGLQFPAFPPFEIPFGSFPPFTGDEEEDGDTSNSSFKGIAALVIEGELFYTNAFHNVDISWSELEMPAGETVGAIAWDYNSAYFSSGDLADQLSLYVICRAGTIMRIYRVLDIKNPTDIDVVHTYTSTSIISSEKMIISTNKTGKNTVFAAWLNKTAVRYSVSFDGGASFDDGIVGSSGGTNYFTEDLELGAATHGEICVTSGIAVGGADEEDLPIGLFMADGSASFSQIPYSGPITATTGLPSPVVFIQNGTDMYAVFNNESTISSPFSAVAWVDKYEYIDTDIYPRWDPGSTWISDGNYYDEMDDPVSPIFGYGNLGPWGPSDDINTRYMDGNLIKISFGGASIPGADRAVVNMTMKVRILTHDLVPKNMFVEAGLGGGEDFVLHGSVLIGPVNGDDEEQINIIQRTSGDLGDDTGITRWFVTDVNFRGSDCRFAYVIPSGGAVGFISLGRQLTRITNYSSSPTWLEAEPNDASTPERPFDMTKDLLNGDKIYVSTETNNLYYSTTHGTSWTLKNVSASTKKTIIAKGNNIIVAGLNYVGISTDGSTYTNKTGNLLSMVSGSATVRQILAI